MKKNILIVVFVYAFILLSCENGEESIDSGRNNFQFVLSSNAIYSSARMWITVYSANGDLICYEEVFNSNSYLMELGIGSVSDRFIVQILSRNDNGYNVDCNVSCYVDVQPDIWHLDGWPEGKYNNQIGTEVIELSGIDWTNYSYHSSRNKCASGDFESDNKLSFRQSFNPDNIFVMLKSQNGIPYYKWIEDVGLNANYTWNIDDFTPMTDYTICSFPSNISGYIWVTAENGTLNTSNDRYPILNEDIVGYTGIRIHYPTNVFSNYSTRISLDTEYWREYYIKTKGSVASEFKQLDADIIVIDNSIDNFIAKTTGNVDYGTLNWYYEDYGDYGGGQTFNYTVIGSLKSIENFSAPQFPAEIVALDEESFDLDALVFSRPYMGEYDNFNGFDDVIRDWLIEPNVLSRNCTEYCSKYIRNSNYKKSVKGIKEHEHFEDYLGQRKY